MSDLALRILLQATDMASSVIKSAGDSLKNMGTSASGAGPGLAMAAEGATLVAGAILSTIGPAADFQAQLTNLVTGAGELPQNLGMVSDGILKIAQDTGTATKDLISAMFMINSSGKIGAEGLNVLKIAAQGAKTDNADLTKTTMALTGIMTNFKIPASGAAGAMNEIIAASKAGKMHMEQLASALGPIGEVAVNAGLKFADVGGAIAMMTNANVSAQQASQNLAFAIRALDAPSGVATKSMKAVGLSAQQVADTLRNQGLPAALQLIEEHVGKKFPQSSTEWTTAMKNIMGGKSGLNVALAVGGDNLQAYEKNVKGITGALNAGGTEVEGWSAVQGNFNTKMAQAQEAVEVLKIKIGTALLPIVTKIMDAIQPVITGFSSFVDWLSKTNLLVPVLSGVLAGCAALILAVVVPALWSMAAGVIAATWPFALIAAAIAGAVAAFLYFYNNSKPFKDLVDGMMASVKNFVSALSTNLQPVLQGIVSFLQSTFAPVWKQLQDTWNSEILPSVRQLISTFNQVKPELTILAQFIGGVLVVAFGLVVGVIGGFIGALSGVIQGIAEVIGGVVQIITGVVQVISGIISFVVDLFTGQWGKLGGDIQTIFNGIGNIFSGFGNVVKGIANGIVKGVEGAFSGMATSTLDYFNQIVHGADDKTKAASIAAQTHTAQMKDRVIQNAQLTNEQTQIKFQNMRAGIEDQLKQTTDAAQRHTLQMKLKVVDNAIETSQKAGQQYVDLRYKSQEQLDLLKQGVDVSTMSAADRAKYHALNMKDMYLGGVEQMDNQTIQKVDHMRLGIIDELSRTTDGAKRHALEIQLTQVTHAENAAKQVKEKHVQMRKDTESEMDKMRKSWFQDRWKDIQNIWGGIGKWFQDRWKDIAGAWQTGVNKVVEFFEYLYKHSYVFQHIVDAVHNAFNTVIGFIQNVWKTVSKWVVNEWNALVGHAKDLWNKVSKAVSDGWNAAVKWVQDTWKSISDTFTNAWNTYVAGPLATLWTNVSTFFSNVWTNYVSTPVSNFWKSISTAFSNAWTDHVSKPLSDLWTNISNTVSGWATDAWTWGVNLITGLASGITSAVGGALHNALNGAATAIKNVVGWHSPTKEGPGADSDKWAPNLVKMMSTGLESGVPQIQNAVNKLANPIAMTLNTGGLSSLGGVNLKGGIPIGSGGTTNNSSGTNINIVINVPQGRIDRAGAQQIAQVVKDELSRELRGSGKLTTWTSGGSQ